MQSKREMIYHDSAIKRWHFFTYTLLGKLKTKQILNWKNADERS